MSVRLAIDFGTATTCVATIRNLVTFEPELISLQGVAPFCDSVVWIDDANGKQPLIRSGSRYHRHPLALCDEANGEFAKYWKTRIHAQGDSLRRYYWELNDREKAMLLSYYKPELADNPASIRTLVPGAIHAVYDPETQSSDVSISFEQREIANPAPDTDDMIAATAALIRRAVELAVAKYDEGIDRLVIGMPSYASDDTDEARRARSRREAAVAAANIASDYGSHTFRVTVLSEAEAAGYGLNLTATELPFLIAVIDVGAGTTDMALLEFRRDSHGRTRPGAPLLHNSIRYAGRDLNSAIAGALMSDKRMRAAYEAMDGRSWQLLLERDIEFIKRNLTDEPKDFKIPVHEYAAWSSGSEAAEARRRALYRTILFQGVSLQDPFIKTAVQRSCREWREALGAFLNRASEISQQLRIQIASIELVGGAFRFEPLCRTAKSAVVAAGIDTNKVKYRDTGDESQTVVARGLARWVALTA